MEDFARVEYCVMDKSDNNVEVFQDETSAIKYAQENNYPRVLEVAYAKPNENGDESEIYAKEIWSLDNDFEKYEGTAYYAQNFSGVADVIETNEYSEVEAWTWNMLQQGLFVEIKDRKSGKSQRLTPEDINENGVDINVDESLNEDVEIEGLKLVNAIVKSWKDYYINDMCDGDEEEFNDLYYDEYDEEYWQEPCQVAFDVVDSEGHKICTLTVYKFDGMPSEWYEIGISDAIDGLEDKLELQDLDIEENGWYPENVNHNLLKVEEYEELVKPYLEQIAQALR